MKPTKSNKAAQKKTSQPSRPSPVQAAGFTGSRLEVPASTRGEKAHEAASNALLGGSLTHNPTRHHSNTRVKWVDE